MGRGPGQWKPWVALFISYESCDNSLVFLGFALRNCTLCPRPHLAFPSVSLRLPSCLALLRTPAVTCRAHPGNTAGSHVQILRLITPAKTPLPNKVRLTGSRGEDLAPPPLGGGEQWKSRETRLSADSVGDKERAVGLGKGASRRGSSTVPLCFVFFSFVLRFSGPFSGRCTMLLSVVIFAQQLCFR